jgi:hypothetical protein
VSINLLTKESATSQGPQNLSKTLVTGDTIKNYRRLEFNLIIIKKIKII